MRKAALVSTTVRAAGALALLLAAASCTDQSVSTAAPISGPSREQSAAPCSGFNCPVSNPTPCDSSASLLAHDGDTSNCAFAIRSKSVLYDGGGYAIGTIDDASVRIDYGQRKALTAVSLNPASGLPKAGGTPEAAVFVSNVHTSAGLASGWVFESALRESVDGMPTVVGSDPGTGDYTTNWRLTGGDDATRAGYDGMVFANGQHPNDFLLRGDGAVTMLYNLPDVGGVEDEAYLTTTDAVFLRSKGAVVTYVPYYVEGAPAGSPAAGTMGFMYGHVGDRYGWVSRDAATSDASCSGNENCKLPNPLPCKVSGYGGSNRLSHDGNANDCSFMIADGTVMYDGNGIARDTLISTQVKINYGQRKQLPDGQSGVYVWDATTTGGHESGWIHESDLTESVAYMPTVALSDPGQGDYPRTFVITGGDTTASGPYANTVLCADTRPCTELPAHYLLRPGGVVNILFNLPGEGGVSDDTYGVTGAAVHFHRSRGVGLLSVPYYDGNAPANSPPVGYMQFMFGHVGTRYGWIAVDATTASGH